MREKIPRSNTVVYEHAKYFSVGTFYTSDNKCLANFEKFTQVIVSYGN